MDNPISNGLEMKQMRISLIVLLFSLSVLQFATISAVAQVQNPAGWPSPSTSDARLSGAEPGTGWIIGTIQATDRRDVSDATVELRGAKLQHMTTRSAPDGSFQITNVPTGEYEVIAQQGILQSRTEVFVTSGANWVTLTFQSQGTAADRSQAAVSAAQLAVPANAKRELLKAQDAVNKGKWDVANRYLQKALTLWPKYAEALVLRSLIERDQHFSSLAIVDAEKAVQFDPNYGRAYVVLGATYTDVNRWDDAVRTLDHGIAVAPTYWQGYYEMSRVLLLKGDSAAALRQAEKASTLAPNEFPTLHLIKGYAYLGLKNPASARAELETYVKLRPSGKPATKAREIISQLSASSDGHEGGNAATTPSGRESTTKAEDPR